jgi:ligand-binding sensor domain-containing protein
VVDTLKWLGNYLSGLYYGSDTLFFSFDDGGLPGNLVTSLSSDIDGNVAGGFNIEGLAVFDSDGWETHIFDQIGHGVRTLVHDILGGIWAGTWGRGLSLIRGDSITTFNESNSDLHGVPDAPEYVVVNRVAADDHYVFMSNFAPRDGNPVRVVDVYGTAGWQSFGVDDGLSITLLNSIDCRDGVFVVGTEDNGIFYYYYGPDPFDKSDDSIINLRESNSWLNSDNIRTVKFDEKGILWVGTRYGLSRYDPGIDRFINVSLPIGFGPEVTQLEFDRRGNMWMGSQNGLARYDAGTGSIQVFTTLNSGLSDDRITALLINPTSNNLWVGTSEGISVLESTIGPPAARVEDVIAFPNPFIIRSSSDVLSFNYSGEAFVRIYTINGELVREADINIPWDGKNQQGADVAPGPYLFLLTAEDGSVGRGKILLIRE